MTNGSNFAQSAIPIPTDLHWSRLTAPILVVTMGASERHVSLFNLV